MGRDAGGRGATAAHERHARREGPTVKAGGGRAWCGAHVEHVDHGCDAGRVEVERLVERRRVLPSGKEGRAMRSEVWAGRREGVRRRQRMSGMHGERARL